VNDLIYCQVPELLEQVKEKWAGLVFDKANLSTSFHDELLNARRVISTAGCQLIGECKYLGIPMELYPIPNQYEQTINAFDYNILGIKYCVNKVENGIHNTIKVINEII
jgi:UDP-N-acetylglucosamine:LPS N-acetylglucosamine transferase